MSSEFVEFVVFANRLADAARACIEEFADGAPEPIAKGDGSPVTAVDRAVEDRLCIVVDPMLATGNSAVAAVQKVKDAGAVNIKFACLLTAPEGVKVFSAAHPDVPIFTAAIDRQLNDHGYILPGLGDAGDRIYGTK